MNITVSHTTPTLAASFTHSAAALPPRGAQFAPWDGPAALIRPPRLRPDSSHRARSPCPVMQQAPRQRHPQQLVESVVNHERDHERQRKIVAESHAEDREQDGEVDRAREDETELVDQQNVEDVDADDEGEGQQVPPRAHPVAGDEPWRTLAALGARDDATGDEQQGADA